MTTPLETLYRPEVTRSRRFGGFIILAISVAALPFTAFLAINHPEGTHVPASLLVIPLGMVGVGFDRLFPGGFCRRILRLGGLALFAVGCVATLAFWFVESRGSSSGFQIGDHSGQYAAQNFFALLFLPLLFLYASSSEKTRQLSSPFVWFGFVTALFISCVFIGLGLSAMLGNH